MAVFEQIRQFCQSFFSPKFLPFKIYEKILTIFENGKSGTTCTKPVLEKRNRNIFYFKRSFWHNYPKFDRNFVSGKNKSIFQTILVNTRVHLFLFSLYVTLTLFFTLFPFDPPENIRKPLVFWCFQGDQKGTLERKPLTEIFLK